MTYDIVSSTTKSVANELFSEDILSSSYKEAVYVSGFGTIAPDDNSIIAFCGNPNNIRSSPYKFQSNQLLYFQYGADGIITLTQGPLDLRLFFILTSLRFLVL